MVSINVLYLSYQFPPINAAASFRALKITNNLHDKGIHAVVITKNVEKEVHIHRTTDFSLLKEICKDTKVLRARYFSPTVFHLPFKLLRLVRAVIQGKKSTVGRTQLRASGELPRDPFIPDHYIEWIPLAFAKILRSKEAINADVIYASGPPFSIHLLGYLLKAWLRKPLILEYRDVLVDDPYNKAYEIKEKVNRFLERVFLKNTDAVVSVSQPIIDQLAKKYNMPLLTSKAFEIPSAFDPDDFENVDAVKHDPKDFVITLTTTLYGARRPDVLFQVLGRLKHEGIFDGINFSLNIYGYNEVERFKKELERLDLGDIVHFKGFVPHDDCLAILKGSTYNLDLGEQDFDYPTVPFHFWEYIGTGKQILHFGFSSHYKARFVKNAALGIVLPIEDPNQIAEKMTQLVDQFKNGTLQTALEPDRIACHSWSSRVARLSRVIRAIAKK